jgi:hypothetical protein
MRGKKEKHYDFSKEYKVLPVKKRVRLIMIARTLLKLQKENAVTLTDSGSCEKVERDYAQIF